MDKIARSASPGEIGRYKLDLLWDPCAYCGGVSEFLDHITPRRDGGHNQWDNLIGTCRRCNGEKGARSLLAFLGAKLHRPRWDAVDVERSLWASLGRRPDPRRGGRR